jgi:hypothetical protein
MMRRAEQHRLPAQRDAGFAVVEHAVGDIPGLRCLVLDSDQERPLRRSLVEYRVFAICSLAPAITAFAASRIGWVER